MDTQKLDEAFTNLRKAKNNLLKLGFDEISQLTDIAIENLCKAVKKKTKGNKGKRRDRT